MYVESLLKVEAGNRRFNVVKPEVQRSESQLSNANIETIDSTADRIKTAQKDLINLV